jgi:hypothetical protein
MHLSYGIQWTTLQASALALGMNCQDIGFYSSLHQKADEEHLSTLSVETNCCVEDIKNLWLT